MQPPPPPPGQRPGAPGSNSRYPSFNPNNFFLQNPAAAAFSYYQNFNLPPYLHTPNNLVLQNPLVSIQNPNSYSAVSNQNQYQNRASSSFQSPPHAPIQNPNSYAVLNQNSSSLNVTPVRRKSDGKDDGRKKSVDRVDGKKKRVDKADDGKNSADRADGGMKSAGRADGGMRSAGRVDGGKKIADRADGGKKSADMADGGKKSADRNGDQKKGIDKVDAQRQTIERADAAVRRARKELVAVGEGVSAWNVSEAALLKLQVQSWSALGLQMQDVPMLKQLIAIEGKINAFIHCYVGVRRITSLYELELAICKREGVEHFDELELGPLIQHPLVRQYFYVRPEVTCIHKISATEILLSLSEYMDIHMNQKIDVFEFMDFLANKHSVSKEMLCVRIQNLGMHISFIREATMTEKAAVKRTTKILLRKRDNTKAKVSILNSQKKELDERFHALSQRVTSFSTTCEDLQGKHIRFASSSSEDEESDGPKSEDGSSSKLFMHRADTSDRVGSCPYPSATEEMTRLGMKEEFDDLLSAGDCNIKSADASKKRKRKLGSRSSGFSNPSKLVKRDVVCSGVSKTTHNSVSREDIDTDDQSGDNSSTRAFITTWKEACHNQTATEVFDRMLLFYKATPKQRRKIHRMFSSNPCAAILRVAIESIKSGMWDSVYDACQSMGNPGFGDGVVGFGSSCCESIEIEPNVKKGLTIAKCGAVVTQSLLVSNDNIIKKIVMYTALKSKNPTSGNSSSGTKFAIFRNMSCLERWLSEQFSVTEFKSLGHGEFSEFLERNVSLIPSDFLKQLVGEESEKPLLEVSMLKNQLDLFLLQAFNSLSEGGNFTRRNIHDLLSRQFPSISFSTVHHGSPDLLIEKVIEQRSCAISKCVLFSTPLLDVSSTEDTVTNLDKSTDFTHLKNDLFRCSGVLGHKTSKDATDTLLQAPMLFNLHAWSHWDIVFAPSLGPLVDWLLEGVRSEELLCLVTTDSVVIRINHLATTSSFLEAARQGSAFGTAVELTSLFSLLGGRKHVPMFLLKSYAQQAFEVILANAMDNLNMPGMQTFGDVEKSARGAEYVPDVNARSLFSKPCTGVTVAIRFILDCLSFVPSEFQDIAANILISGLSHFVKNIPLRILYECQKTHERVMIHRVGLSLGINEWIEDHHKFILNVEEFSCTGFITEPAGSKLGKSSICVARSQEKTPCMGLGVSNEKSSVRMEQCIDTSGCDRTINKPSDMSAVMKNIGDAEVIIESIRREEFGLDLNMAETENIMLMKQHERLGRALQCLSQELYSQDSHFLLELVQNADDNVYPKSVEPTLIFILQESGIVVLNNEHGFSEQNIRALCDIANSTKKVAGADYIGKKGIGFKSVFRVTDAPEIHSNNFHVKFDIREGRIGFVCPTVIPPCDIQMFHRLASDGSDEEDLHNWRTCIVLPFSSKLSGAATNITPMFADLHPSLLLFLHRLQCIKLRNTLDDSLVVMKKEIIGDGIIKVSHGVEEMTWLVVSQQMQANSLGANSKATEISIAFTLLESDDGCYSPCLNQQPVFAFLPLRTYGLRFIIQGDFVLPSSREGVDADSLWNQWLLSEFPNLFVNAEKSFCGIPCYRDNPGKAVTVYMSFVPLVGEVHGFFSNLPRMIISKLRASNCLLKEGDESIWVPPCKVVRNWSDHALGILPDTLLHDHLGKGFLNKNIYLSNPLAEALGVEEYGPNVLLRIISSLCYSDGGLRSLGFEWLCSCLGELHDVMFQSHWSTGAGSDRELTDKIRKIPFIPLSSGTFSSVDEGTIWMHFDVSTNGPYVASGSQAFPYLYAKLRTVSTDFLSAANRNTLGNEMMLAKKISVLFRHIGVQKMSDHDILKVHILPAIADEKFANENRSLMTEYLSFIMVHLQSSCMECTTEKQYLVSELRCKALLLTNYGYKRPNEVSIHFSKEYGSSIEVTKLINDLEWCEIDGSYLKHSGTKALPRGQLQWRAFFSDLGINDFVSVRQVRKSLNDIPPSHLKVIMLDYELESTGLFAMDWESSELARVLAYLSSNGSRDNCIYMLKILDAMWDEYYNDKMSGYWDTDTTMVTKIFPSSFSRSISDNQWVVSSIDDALHYPRDLFHDCAAVRTILGNFAPYAVPTVKSKALLKALGLRTHVTMNDILDVFRVWRRSSGSFRASIEQMSSLYTFIWNGTSPSKMNVFEELLSGPFIFVPEVCDFSHADLVNGAFYSVEEVYWHDFSGSISPTMTVPKSKASERFLSCSPKVLCNIYPGLHDFFVKDCGVNAFPPLRDYLEMLLQLTKSVLPSQAAHAVLQVFTKWADEYDSGVVSSKEIDYLKECLLTTEYKILPTEQNKWVSLHPTFGFMCWSDDEKLKKEFGRLENIDFICFGEVADDYEVLQTKVHVLLTTLGIPALSQVVTREAIFYGIVDNNIKSLLVNWAIPFAQRYMYNLHPEKYCQLKDSVCQDLRGFHVVVVEKLFYRNTVKRCALASTNRSECESLLQDNTLYTTEKSDTHSLFMELSRLLFNGNCELHLANFLHMITTMAESGSSQDQIEFFILNSQKLAKLPTNESIWSLPSCSSTDNFEEISNASSSKMVDSEKRCEWKNKSKVVSCWPPADRKTDSGSKFARDNGYQNQDVSQNTPDMLEDHAEYDTSDPYPPSVSDVGATWISEDVETNAMTSLDLQALGVQPDFAFNQTDMNNNLPFDNTDSNSFHRGRGSPSTKFNMRPQLNTGNPDSAQALLTGKLGELVAYKYYLGKAGDSVNWVNKDNESGLPYDIVIGEGGNDVEYIEVKSTRSARKDWFMITTREWQYAIEKGESFSITHVVLQSDNTAKITTFKNPARLCQLGKLQLVVMMPSL